MHSSISVEKYTCGNQKEWDKFCNESKNSLFMFNRKFMEYHSDRFMDHSLIFYKDNEIIALLPANIVGNILYSHAGLTFGGFIIGNKMKQHIMNDCFDSLLNYMKVHNFSQLIYKMIPHIYHTQPAEEDKYCLYINKAKISKIEASTVINLNKPLKMSKGRKAQISRAKREGVVIEELIDADDFKEFIAMENTILLEKYNTKATHTGDELNLLKLNFPKNLHLFGAKYNSELIAGSVIFEYDEIVHTQYMATKPKGREIGALDLTIYTIMERYRQKKQWLDFGISTENSGYFLNDGLISQKESFGGRTNIYETWIIKV